jgi:hypothetical protein
MAKRSRKVILNPDIDDDSDDEPPTMCTPDDDGWVYLKRSAKPPKDTPRAETPKQKPKRKPR